MGVRAAEAGMNDHLTAQWKSMLNMIPAHTGDAGPAGALTFVNVRCADYLGLGQDDPLRLGTETNAAWDSHIPLLHPDDHDETRKVWSTCLKTGQAGEVSFRLRNASGYRWFLSRAEPLRGDDGTLLAWIGINLDIEERKRAEFYLAEGQRLAHSGSWAFRAGGFEYWSSELFKIHGLEPAQTAPTISEYMSLVHPEDRGYVAQQIQDMLEHDAAFDFTKRIVRPDGEIRHVRCVGRPSTSGETFHGFVGTGVDVTEEAQLTRALRKSEEELREILDLTPQIVGVFGPKLERLYANRVALDYYGLSLDEWRRTDIRAEVHPDDLDRVKEQVAHSLSAGSPFEMEKRLRDRNGIYRWFLGRYSAVKDEQERIIRWHVACTDIQDRKEAEDRLQQENVALREEIDKTSMFEEIVGASPALNALLSRVSKVAGSDSTVLITGETGTGKELVARAIHRRSRRCSGAFVAVNCAAISRELLASELFGHEKGAFTGATQRRLGRFELADGGTIFLDEVGELFPETQVALLRVLQERVIERVGGTQPIRVDVRIIAATNEDLNAGVDSGTFRQDLFYRLNVFPLEVPPLRERKEDVPVLVEYFINHYARKAGKTFRHINKRTLDRLRSYPWPGNVRELQNVIERSVIVCESDEFAVDESWLSTRSSSESRRPLFNSLAAHEKTIIEGALRASGGRVFGHSGAAERLGIPRSTLESKIRTLKIDKSRFRLRAAKN